MIIIMEEPKSRQEVALIDAQVKAVADLLRQEGFNADISRGVERNIVGLLGKIEPERAESFMARVRSMPGVVKVERISTPYPRVALRTKPEGTTVPINGIAVGGNQLLVIAGPCAVESEEQLEAAMTAVKELGAGAFRAGAYKPRTGPYSFQGLGEAGCIMLRQAKLRHRFPTVSEVTAPGLISQMYDAVDVFQVGMRNMQNFELLRALGRQRKPVLLKRNQAVTLDEFLQAAEYIAVGNSQIILCLRGTRREYGMETRYTPDIGDIAVLKRKTHLPVVWDPSHAAGDRNLVIPLALAGIAAGADGLLVEFHPNPMAALSDADQQLDSEQLAQLMAAARRVAEAVGRTL